MSSDPFIATADDAGERRSRILFTCFLVFVALYTLAFSVLMTLKNSSYIIGDWLINYSGGFVRRGLIGTFVLAANHATHIPLRWIVFVIQGAVFLLFLWCVYRLSKGIRWTFLMTAIMLSPATLAFTVLESYAGIRKEMLLFAALAWVLCVILSGRWSDAWLSAALSVIVVGLVLSHEALVVGTPYLVAALLIETGSVRRTVKICLAPLLLGSVALIAVILHPGNHAITVAVCNSVGGKLVPFSTPSEDICNGAIQWLEISLPEARALNLPIIRETHMVGLFSLLVFPVFVPLIAQLVMLWRRDKLYREVWVVVGFGLISMVGTAVLFYTARDWGRWLHMQAICLMLILMMVDRRAAPLVERESSPVMRHRWLRAVATVAVFLYVTTWTLPSIGDGGETHGYIENIHMFRHWVPTPPSKPGGKADRSNGAASRSPV
jgi:hypothetical protein